MKEHFAIIAPCYNEEETVREFLDQLGAVLSALPHRFSVLVVDDGSGDKTADILNDYAFTQDNIVLNVIRLEYNSGHQRAIAQGLKHALKMDALGYIVMDSDGEDNPEAIKDLVALENFDIVFVTRGRRHESLKFKISYFLYRLLFRTVTSRKINFGNYSMISRKVLETVSRRSFSHYPAFLSKQRYEQHSIQYDRNPRIAGRSRMSFHSLVFHGLNGLIEYSEELLGFLIKVYIATILGLLALGGVVLYKKFISHEAILGWTSTLGISLFNASLIIISSILISLLVISNKRQTSDGRDIYKVIK